MKPIVLTAAAIAILAAPAHAVRAPAAHDPQAALGDYVRARAAADLGEFRMAADSYAAAWRAAPADTSLALATLRQAVAAGDMPLALKTAHTLDAGGSLPPDGVVLLLAEAVMKDDWRQASVVADRIRDQKLYAFLIPVVRGWIALGEHRPDPQGVIDATQVSALAAAFAPEHRVLLLIASGDTNAGAAAFSALRMPAGAQSNRFRVTVAASLAAKGDRAAAMAILVGDDPAIVRARDLVAAGREVPGAADTPRAGIAELLVRVGTEMGRAQAGILALEMARAATWLAPRDGEAWLVTAGLLVSAGDNDGALAALSQIAPDDPLTGNVRDARLAILLRQGRNDEALAEARAAVGDHAARPGDWQRYGDMLSERQRYAEAADAYAHGLAAYGDRPQPGDAWPLLLQQANAELQSGDWPKARGTAQRALAIAPDRAETLNFLGYTELDRGGDVRSASALIAKASTLAPNDPSIIDSLGWSWYVRGDLARAIKLLEQAARGAPANPEINDHLGDAYWRAGRRLEARFAWRAALVTADPGDATRIKAKIDGGGAVPAGRT